MIIIIQNLVAIPILISIFLAKDKQIEFTSFCEGLIISASMNEDYVCDELKKEFSKINIVKVESGTNYNKKDKDFMKSIFRRYWKHPFFVAKCFMKLGEYSYLSAKYKPKAYLVNNEFSFTSSFLTEYCNMNNILHINIMHGEKLLYIRDSFVSYSRYYVWDDYYVDLLCRLRAEPEQFHIGVPSCLKLHITKNPLYIYTYYLGAESGEELIFIKENMLKLSNDLNKLCVRLHPRYSDEDEVRKVFYGFIIETGAIPLETSIGNTNCVISLYSTVMYQAYINGKNVMIDDCSNTRKYKELEKLSYIMMKKKVQYMSNILEDGNL